jgi:hypothetical protein
VHVDKAGQHGFAAEFDQLSVGGNLHLAGGADSLNLAAADDDDLIVEHLARRRVHQMAGVHRLNGLGDLGRFVGQGRSRHRYAAGGRHPPQFHATPLGPGPVEQSLIETPDRREAQEGMRGTCRGGSFRFSAPQAFCIAALSRLRRLSSVVERILGKAEVDSSILSGGTTGPRVPRTRGPSIFSPRKLI